MTSEILPSAPPLDPTTYPASYAPDHTSENIHQGRLVIAVASVALAIIFGAGFFASGNPKLLLLTITFIIIAKISWPPATASARARYTATPSVPSTVVLVNAGPRYAPPSYHEATGSPVSVQSRNLHTGVIAHQPRDSSSILDGVSVDGSYRRFGGGEAMSAPVPFSSPQQRVQVGSGAADSPYVPPSNRTRPTKAP